ncbi:MAG TPA: acyloxyacyl hydrolase [Gammaproteobacteria bacterium]|nr:acyloxyacyl hydrolase [Gammaproteobacteria bacterium]
MEFGTGPASVSATAIESRRLSIAFQFGSHTGLGLRFGPHYRFEVACRLMGDSSADIKRPDDGVTFSVLEVAGLSKHGRRRSGRGCAARAGRSVGAAVDYPDVDMTAFAMNGGLDLRPSGYGEWTAGGVPFG